MLRLPGRVEHPVDAGRVDDRDAGARAGDRRVATNVEVAGLGVVLLASGAGERERSRGQTDHVLPGALVGAHDRRAQRARAGRALAAADVRRRIRQVAGVVHVRLGVERECGGWDEQARGRQGGGEEGRAGGGCSRRVRHRSGLSGRLRPPDLPVGGRDACGPNQTVKFR